MEHTLFFELIQIAVGNRELFSRIPSSEDWEKLFEEAKRQALVGVTYDALGRLPSAQHPPKKVLMNWHALTEKISADNERVNKDAVWATERFHKAGFRSVILKGQGNALLYPNPSHRQSGDIDVWTEGERNDIIRYVLRFFPKQRVQWLEVEFPVRKETVIEVHTAPSVLFCPSDNRRLQAFYAKHQEQCFTHNVTLPDGIIHTPTWEVNVIFQLTHIYRHLFFEGIGLRQLMDYYYLLLTRETDRRNLEEILKDLHMTRFANAVMWVLHEVFMLEEDKMITTPKEEEGRFLLNEIMLAGNFGMYDTRNEIKASKWGNFWQITNRNWRFLTRYPREVLWNPWYRIKQFFWRKWNGFN